MPVNSNAGTTRAGDGPKPGAPSAASGCPDDAPRIDWLICWYEREAKIKNRAHKGLRVASIAAAAAIPVLAAASAQPVFGALLGGSVVALEAIQELFQFQRNYVTFATAKEALKRERALYAAAAGPYRRSRTKDRDRLLAERVEALVATETAGWADLQLGDKKAEA
jgi:Protein of unknown function (DUF4231)